MIILFTIDNPSQKQGVLQQDPYTDALQISLTNDKRSNTHSLQPAEAPLQLGIICLDRNDAQTAKTHFSQSLQYCQEYATFHQQPENQLAIIHTVNDYIELASQLKDNADKSSDMMPRDAMKNMYKVGLFANSNHYNMPGEFTPTLKKVNPSMSHGETELRPKSPG